MSRRVYCDKCKERIVTAHHVLYFFKDNEITPYPKRRIDLCSDCYDTLLSDPDRTEGGP